MPFWHSELDMLHRNRERVRIALGHVENKPSVQTSGPDRFKLFEASRRSELQFGARLTCSESPE